MTRSARALTLLPLALALLVPASASARRTPAPKPALRKVAKNHWRLALPDGWQEMPEVAAQAQAARLKDGDSTGEATGWGDAKLGAKTLAMWVQSNKTVGTVRPGLEWFHA